MVANLKMTLKAVLQNKDTHNVSNNKQCISNNRLTDLEWLVANTTRGLKCIFYLLCLLLLKHSNISQKRIHSKSHKKVNTTKVKQPYVLFNETSAGLETTHITRTQKVPKINTQQQQQQHIYNLRPDSATAIDVLYQLKVWHILCCCLNTCIV